MTNIANFFALLKAAGKSGVRISDAVVGIYGQDSYRARMHLAALAKILRARGVRVVTIIELDGTKRDAKYVLKKSQ